MTEPEIGSLQRTFKPGMDNLIAGIIIGLLLIGGGGTIVYFAIKGIIARRGDLPFWAERGWSWGTVALSTILSIGLAIAGVFLIRWMRSLLSLRVHLGDLGFAVTLRKGSQTYLWNQIASVTETHIYERPPLLKGPAKLLLPKTQSKSYSVKRNDDEEFGFTATSLKGHEEFAEMIKTQIDGQGIPWEITEVHL